MKNAFRIVACDARAVALGLAPGTSLADARAMFPTLDLHDADPAADAMTHAAIVDWCRLFTPLAAPDGDDGAILDIAGAAHLFGGEAALMTTIVARLAAQGFQAAVAVAGTPAAAWALARHGGTRRHVPEGLDAASLERLFAPLPLAALRLEPRAVAGLGQAGLRRIGDLMLRPRAPIAARFGPGVHARLDALLGRAKTPISPRFEAPAFVAERRFAEGIARREDVEATIFSLAQDLCGLLARHGEGARTLDVALYRVDGVVKHLAAGTSRPLRDPRAMARLFSERIEAAGEEGLETGYGFEMVRLAALSAERLDAVQPDWAQAGAGDDAIDIADLVDRLGARFGTGRVTRLTLADTYRPEGATLATPAAKTTTKTTAAPRGRGGAVAAPAAPASADALPERPIRLLERPEPIEAIASVPDGPPLRFRWRRVLHQVAAVEGPERIGPDWWRPSALQAGALQAGAAGARESAATRDYFRAEDTDGCRFWLYREGLFHDTPTPRWYLHGFFA